MTTPYAQRTLEYLVGEEQVRTWKTTTVGEYTKQALGAERYNQVRNSVRKIVEQQPESSRRAAISNACYGVLEVIANETAYAFTVDAIANNVASLPFIFNDKYGAGKSWSAAAYTRLSALIVNTATGRFYGLWNDYISSKLSKLLAIDTESRPAIKFGKQWLSQATTFATGQSWLYGGLLVSGDILAGNTPEAKEIAKGMAFLTVLAPLGGPVFSAVYKSIRSQFGLYETETSEQSHLVKRSDAEQG